MASRAKLTARATQSRAKRLKAEMEADSCGSSAAAWAPRAASESAIALPAARKGVVREHAKSWGVGWASTLAMCVGAVRWRSAAQNSRQRSGFASPEWKSPRLHPRMALA